VSRVKFEIRVSVRINVSFVFSERELSFTFAICYVAHASVRRPSVCRVSVTFVRTTQPNARGAAPTHSDFGPIEGYNRLNDAR